MNGVETLQLLELIAPVCRKHGISRLSVGGLEMEFTPVAEKPDPKAMLEMAALLEKSMPSDEEVLYHSAPVMPMAEDQSDGN